MPEALPKPSSAYHWSMVLLSTFASLAGALMCVEVARRNSWPPVIAVPLGMLPVGIGFSYVVGPFLIALGQQSIYRKIHEEIATGHSPRWNSAPDNTRNLQELNRYTAAFMALGFQQLGDVVFPLRQKYLPDNHTLLRVLLHQSGTTCLLLHWYEHNAWYTKLYPAGTFGEKLEVETRSELADGTILMSLQKTAFVGIETTPGTVSQTLHAPLTDAELVARHLEKLKGITFPENEPLYFLTLEDVMASDARLEEKVREWGKRVEREQAANPRSKLYRWLSTVTWIALFLAFLFMFFSKSGK